MIAILADAMSGVQRSGRSAHENRAGQQALEMPLRGEQPLPLGKRREILTSTRHGGTLSQLEWKGERGWQAACPDARLCAMVASQPLSPGEVVGTADQRLIMHNVPWSHYEVLLGLRGDAPVPRMAYLEGSLELISPSRDHERMKTMMARLLEAYAIHGGLPLNGYGSWTLKNSLVERGIEPDECYAMGHPDHTERPDLAIEIIWTSGGLNKLEVYRKLGVPEVWIWRDEVLQVFALRQDQYEGVPRSILLPELDLALLASFLTRRDQTAAVREFLSRLRG